MRNGIYLPDLVADSNVKNYKDGMRCLKGGIHVVAPAIRGLSTLPGQVTYQSTVGWVERSETHQIHCIIYCTQSFWHWRAKSSPNSLNLLLPKYMQDNLLYKLFQ